MDLPITNIVMIPSEKILEIMTATFFDEDGVECIEVEKARWLFPELAWYLIEKRFAFGKGKDGWMPVMTLADLLFVLKVGAANVEDYEYDEVDHCAVCRKVLLPDDEAYVVLRPDGEQITVCDHHSRLDEANDGYKLRIYP